MFVLIIMTTSSSNPFTTPLLSWTFLPFIPISVMIYCSSSVSPYLHENIYTIIIFYSPYAKSYRYFSVSVTCGNIPLHPKTLYFFYYAFHNKTISFFLFFFCRNSPSWVTPLWWFLLYLSISTLVLYDNLIEQILFLLVWKWRMWWCFKVAQIMNGKARIWTQMYMPLNPGFFNTYFALLGHGQAVPGLAFLSLLKELVIS